MKKRIEILFKENRDIKVKLEKSTLISLEKKIDTIVTYLMEVEILDNIGSYQSVITVLYDDFGFSFKPIEVNKNYPIYYEIENVIIREEKSIFSFDNIYSYINKDNRRKEEPTYKEALKNTNGIESSPIILNTPFDCRTFEFGFRKSPIEEKQHYDLYDYIIPHNNWLKVKDEELGIDGIRYRFLLGRGIGVNHKIKRRMEEGVLPILNASVYDDDLEYKIVTFTTILNTDLNKANGTDYLLADSVSAACIFDEKQKERLKTLKFDEEQPVFLMRIEVINHSKYPKLSFVRLPHVNTSIMSEFVVVDGQSFDNKKGISLVKNKFHTISRLNGRSDLLNVENTVLVDKTITYDILVLHNPLDISYIDKYYDFDFDKEYKKVKKYYKNLLNNISTIKTPEKMINEIWKANYIQLRQNCFGIRESKYLSACVGVYTPIGSESEGIISSLASYGDFIVAKKCVNYFFIKERENGFIQNMDGYMLETGGALIIASYVYMVTRDKEWLEELEEKIVKATDYLLEWIKRNKKDENERGYGLIDGRVADPKDDKRIYMLNGNCYKGLNGSIILLKALNNNKYLDVKKYNDELKNNILKSIKENMIYSPLSPLYDGTFAPFVSSWAEEYGAQCLHLNGGEVTTHGTHVAKDSMLSIPYLLKYGVIDLDSKYAEIIFKTQKSICMTHNTCFSQPYYNALPFANIRKGNIEDFLEEFYYALASLSDKETYYFWEHLFLATPHKTSEQGFFEQRLKDMFAYDDLDENIVIVFKAIPKKWLDAKNNRVEIKNLKLELGTISVSLSNYSKNKYKINIKFIPYDKETKIKLYLPYKSDEYLEEEYKIIDYSENEILYETTIK